MKKQAQRKPRTRKTVAQPEVAWHVRAQELPLALFHTTIGPIIGHVETVDSLSDGFNLRLWAPAAVRMSYVPGQPGVTRVLENYTVMFQPIALVETYLDLSVETPFGRSPVPAALIPAYEEYFAKSAAGEYAFARTVAHVEQAAPHGAMVEVEVAARDPAEDQPEPLTSDDVIGADVATDETDVS